jgi:hypothetical protein
MSDSPTTMKYVDRPSRSRDVGPMNLEYDSIYVSISDDGDDYGHIAGAMVAVLPLSRIFEQRWRNPLDPTHRPESTDLLASRLFDVAKGSANVSWGRSSLTIARPLGGRMPSQLPEGLIFEMNGRHRLEALRRQSWKYGVFVILKEDALALVEYFDAVLFPVETDIVLRKDSFRPANSQYTQQIALESLPRWIPPPSQNVREERKASLMENIKSWICRKFREW